MNLRPISIATMALCLLHSAPAFAQSQFELRSSEEEQRKAERVLGAGAPISRTGSGISASNLQAAVSEGEQEIALAVDFDLFNSTRKPPQERGDEFNVSSLNLTIRGSTPLNDEDGEPSNFFSGNSFVTGSKVTVGLTYFSGSQKSGRLLFERDQDPSLVRQVYTACAAKEARALAGDDPAKVKLASEFVERINAISMPAIEFVNDVRLSTGNANPDLAQFANTFEQKCLQGGLDDTVRTYLPSVFDRFERAAFSSSPLFFLGVSGTVGDENFSVLNRTDFKLDDVSRTPWQADAYAGLIGPNQNWSARASVFYGASYEAAESAEFCRTQAGSEEECIMGPDGSPIRNESARVALESRHLFSIGSDSQIGIAPEFTYDIEEDEFQVEVPFYFSPNDEGKLTGGIITRYQSDDDDFSIGLFIGVPFSVRF